MTIIKCLAEDMADELCSAKHYAEMYVENKAKDNSTWASRFKEMANQELQHANYLHDYTQAKIDELSKVYTPPEEMMEKWQKDHNKYVEKAAWIKQMLSM